MTPREILGTVLDDEHAEGVVEHRRVTVKKPLTALAAKILAKEFAKCPDPNAAAEEMILRVWMGFRASWLKPEKPQRQTLSDINSLPLEQILEQYHPSHLQRLS